MVLIMHYYLNWLNIENGYNSILIVKPLKSDFAQRYNFEVQSNCNNGEKMKRKIILKYLYSTLWCDIIIMDSFKVVYRGVQLKSNNRYSYTRMYRNIQYKPR